MVKVRFRVEDKFFEAYVSDNEQWGSIKDIPINRKYEYLPGFEVSQAHIGNELIIMPMRTFITLLEKRVMT